MTVRWVRLLLWAIALGAWSALIVVGLLLFGTGLDKTFIFEPTREALERDRVGKILIFFGSVALFLAAVWARLMHTPSAHDHNKVW